VPISNQYRILELFNFLTRREGGRFAILAATRRTAEELRMSGQIAKRARSWLQSRAPVASLLACALAVIAPSPATADDARAAYAEIAETYGYIPGFFYLFSVDRIAPTWNAFVTLEIDAAITLPASTRELISVAVAAQGTCPSCVYFHAAAAFANGATREQIREAIGIGAATRRLDADLGAAEASFETFRHETDLVLWGDAQTAARRAPPDDFCAFVSAWAGAGHTGCAQQ
jgi:AhpD family alkylhydroperoxidase